MMTARRTIDLYSLSAKPIEVRFRDQMLGSATAFTWSTEIAVYLITNWHVVSGINPISGQHLSSTGAEPDHLVVQMDLVDPIGSRGPFELQLYGADGRPAWLEHPHRKGIDVVAIKLPAMPGAYPHPVNFMPTSPMAIGAGSEAFIIGYPFGNRTGPFPIWKRASIASEPEIPVEGLPYFFVDSASRTGMSGSPVIARTWGLFQEKDGTQTGAPGAHSRFIGVYSSRISDDETKAQVGRVWHGKVIEEIIAGERRGSFPWEC
jgi:hypothetical protein